MTQFDETELDEKFKSMLKKVSITGEEQRRLQQQMNSRLDDKIQTPRLKQRVSLKYYITLSAALFLFILMAMPLLSNVIHERLGPAYMEESIEGILSKSGGYKEILHIEMVEHGAVVFYIPDITTSDEDVDVSELSIMFIKRSLFGWEGTYDRGGYSSNINLPIHSERIPKYSSHSPFPIIYGEIMDPEIYKIQVVDLEGEEIIHGTTITASDHHIWFAFLDNDHGNYEIQGISDRNEILTSVHYGEDTVFIDTQVLHYEKPDYMKENDVESINWDRRAVEFNEGRMLGNENKSGIIGLEVTNTNPQKWMFHFWGVTDFKLGVVGYHRETETIHPILYHPSAGGWLWESDVYGEINGADSHLHTQAHVPLEGEWAFLIYTDGELFDIIVHEITE